MIQDKISTKWQTKEQKMFKLLHIKTRQFIIFFTIKSKDVKAI